MEVRKIRQQIADFAGQHEMTFIEQAEAEETNVVRHHTVFLELNDEDKHLADELLPDSDFLTKGMAKLVNSANQA